MLALLLLWASRQSASSPASTIVAQTCSLRPVRPAIRSLPFLRAAHSPTVVGAHRSAPTPPMALWVGRTGMDLGAFAALMAIYYAFSLSMARLVSASGIYVPDPGLPAKDLMTGGVATPRRRLISQAPGPTPPPPSP
jgi:hypothetical protein